MKIGKYHISEIRKTVVAFIGLVLVVGTSALELFSGFLPDSAGVIAISILGFLTTFGVFWVRNAPHVEDFLDDFELSDNPIDLQK